MKILILSLILFHPIKLVKSMFYKVTNFYVNHIQPNQKAKGYDGKLDVGVPVNKGKK